MSLGLTEFRESTKPLLRQHQVADLDDEHKRVKEMIEGPQWKSTAVDKAEAVRRLRRIERQLNDSTPRPYALTELDAAVRRRDQLQAEFLQGMPTQAEMRRNPAGAVDKHRAWEARNKQKINEWRNIQYRLHRSHGGADDGIGLERDIGNIERFRPAGGPLELNMHNEQIVRPDIHLPPPGAGLVAVMSAAEEAFLAENFPTLAGAMAILSNDQRAAALAEVQKLMAVPPAPKAAKAPKAPKAKAARKPMSAEAKAALIKRFADAKAKRATTAAAA